MPTFRHLTLMSTMALWGMLCLLPLFLNSYSQSQLSIYFCYGMLAMSLALVWGQLGLLSLGQAIFFGIGAYTMALATLDKIPFLHQGQMWFGLLLAVVVSMFCAYLMALLLFNGNHLDGAFLGLVTLAMAIIAERFFGHWRYVGGENGLYDIPGLSLTWLPSVDSLSETALYYVNLTASMLIACGLYAIKYSRYGLFIKVTRQNEYRANHLGIHTIRIKVQMFVLAAGIAALSGALFVSQFYFVSPDLVGFSLSTQVLIWTAVGGRYSFTAAFFGAITVRLLENYLGDYLGHYWLLSLGVIFIIVVIFLPKGLFGHWVR